MNGAASIASCTFQPVEVAVIVLFGEKTGLAVYAAQKDAQRDFGELETSAARHDCSEMNMNAKLTPFDPRSSTRNASAAI